MTAIPEKSIAKRNGKIEFFRFFFSIAVLLFHLEKYILGESKCGGDIRLSLFVHGSIGVEFFFLVSGYLMAKSARKITQSSLLNKDAIGAETWKFVSKKFGSMWLYHSIAWIFTLILYTICKATSLRSAVEIVLQSVPSYFFLQMTGIRCVSPNDVEWYLSAMMIGMFLIFPLLLRFGNRFSKIAAPLTAALLVGWLSRVAGRLTGVMVWEGFAYRSVIRGIAELCLGVTAYELSEHLKTQQLKKRTRVLLTVLEYGCYAGVLVFMLLTLDHKYEPYALMALFVAITLSFSDLTYGNVLFSNKFVYWLGDLSLPVYLTQVFSIMVITNYAADLPENVQVIAGFALVIVLSLILQVANKFVKRK